MQDAFLNAFKTWPYSEMPADPAAWLYRAATNRMLNILRQDRRSSLELDAEMLQFHGQDESDGELRLLFLSCHPALTETEQVMLVMRTVGGLGAKEIARAFMISDAAASQRLVRVRKRVQESAQGFELPEDSALVDRRDAVLKAIYLIFNEGYAPTLGSGIPDVGLCETVISILQRLCTTSVGGVPETHALLALCCFHRARVEGRVDGEGCLVDLEHQDRSEWKREWMAEGIRQLPLAAGGRRLTAYHLEAGIAAEHTLAPSFVETNWRGIYDQYDSLGRLSPSIQVEVSASLALAKAFGLDLGYQRLMRISGADDLVQYWAAQGWFAERMGRDAQPAYMRALNLTTNEAERQFFGKKVS